jgi:hypothetical protein
VHTESAAAVAPVQSSATPLTLPPAPAPPALPLLPVPPDGAPATPPAAPPPTAPAPAPDPATPTPAAPASVELEPAALLATLAGAPPALLAPPSAAPLPPLPCSADPAFADDAWSLVLPHAVASSPKVKATPERRSARSARVFVISIRVAMGVVRSRGCAPDFISKRTSRPPTHESERVFLATQARAARSRPLARCQRATFLKASWPLSAELDPFAIASTASGHSVCRAEQSVERPKQRARPAELVERTNYALNKT